MNDLEQISTISQKTLIDYQRNQSNIQYVLNGCVHLAIINAKTRTTVAYNNFQKCIQNDGIRSNSPEVNRSTPLWNYTTFTTPFWIPDWNASAWNETTLSFTTRNWNQTTTPAWNATNPIWNKTTLNFTTPSWNMTPLNFSASTSDTTSNDLSDRSVENWLKSILGILLNN